MFDDMVDPHWSPTLSTYMYLNRSQPPRPYGPSMVDEFGCKVSIVYATVDAELTRKPSRQYPRGYGTILQCPKMYDLVLQLKVPNL